VDHPWNQLPNSKKESWVMAMEYIYIASGVVGLLLLLWAVEG
jgi:hypothetical protein